MSRIVAAAFALLLALYPIRSSRAADPPPAGGAAPQASTEEAPKSQQIRAVERGAFIEGDVGMNLVVNSIQDRKYGLGALAGLFAGYDILPILSISVGAYAMAASVSRQSNPPMDVQGDLFFII